MKLCKECSKTVEVSEECTQCLQQTRTKLLRDHLVSVMTWLDNWGHNSFYYDEEWLDEKKRIEALLQETE